MQRCQSQYVELIESDEKSLRHGYHAQALTYWGLCHDVEVDPGGLKIIEIEFDDEKDDERDDESEDE